MKINLSHVLYALKEDKIELTIIKDFTVFTANLILKRKNYVLYSIVIWSLKPLTIFRYS